jgi:hypothetical protein
MAVNFFKFIITSFGILSFEKTPWLSEYRTDKRRNGRTESRSRSSKQSNLSFIQRVVLEKGIAKASSCRHCYPDFASQFLFKFIPLNQNSTLKRSDPKYES